MKFYLIQLLTFVSWLKFAVSDDNWNAENELYTLRWDVPTVITSDSILKVQLLNNNDAGFMIDYSALSENSTNNQLIIPKQYIPSNNNYYFEIIFKNNGDPKGVQLPEMWKSQPFSITGNSTEKLETCSSANFISPRELTMWYSSAHPLGLNWTVDQVDEANTFVDYILLSEDDPVFRHSYLDRNVKIGDNQDTLPETMTERGDRYYIEAVLHEHRHTASANPLCKFKSTYFKIRDQWGFY